ncbi:unnamed protein product [Polarella glacialis]|uniref:Uncharacterized protein n=1 Tax=Polarella glacialis TaxID=89957 RepID=A0A813JJY0_POLGL|nr:unnamed protein product [Polarella glacialis]
MDAAAKKTLEAAQAQVEPDYDYSEGHVVTGVPLELFAEGLQARRGARQLMRLEDSEVTPAICSQNKILCEGSFRNMRDCYMMDCRTQTKSCNRLRDLIEECQISCEAAFHRCAPRNEPSALWKKVLPGRWE